MVKKGFETHKFVILIDWDNPSRRVKHDQLTNYLFQLINVANSRNQFHIYFKSYIIIENFKKFHASVYMGSIKVNFPVDSLYSRIQHKI